MILICRRWCSLAVAGAAQDEPQRDGHHGRRRSAAVGRMGAHRRHVLPSNGARSCLDDVGLRASLPSSSCAMLMSEQMYVMYVGSLARSLAGA
jgi:hypothetical protein